jgi:DNA polymerase I-like protein with 3'-5' exonuclease and polymerase domains
LIVNGTVTGRGTHRVIANIPRVTTFYGGELRELFTASPGRVQVGIDVSGLELRMLAHFLAAFDDGAYGRIVCEGDVHTANQLAAGLDNRNQAKTFIYAFLYGGGSEKIGSIAEPLATSTAKTKRGKKLKEEFTAKTPGLDRLLANLKTAAQRGFLKGLDGRKIILRSDHSALNFLLQSGGSLVCMRWMVEVDRMIEARGWRDKVQQLIWYHDELQFDVAPEIAEEFGKAAVDCIPLAGDYFGIRVPLTGEFKIGANWKECH